MEKGEGGDDRFRWKSGARAIPYGLNRLDLAQGRGYVTLVEGESDCHTLWSHGEPALGIPGAGTWNDARDAPLLAEIPRVYLEVEPDEGGESLLRRVEGSALRDRLRIVRL